MKFPNSHCPNNFWLSIFERPPLTHWFPMTCTHNLGKVSQMFDIFRLTMVYEVVHVDFGKENETNEDTHH